jgi:hypothetical protein
MRDTGSQVTGYLDENDDYRVITKKSPFVLSIRLCRKIEHSFYTTICYTSLELPETVMRRIIILIFVLFGCLGGMLHFTLVQQITSGLPVSKKVFEKLGQIG